MSGKIKKKKPATSKAIEREFHVTEGNIFADIGLENPEDLLARSKLLGDVSDLIKASKLTQKEVAKKLHITQPKVSLLMTGRLLEFSRDTLMDYLAILGCKVDIHVTKPSTTNRIFNHRGHVAVY